MIAGDVYRPAAIDQLTTLGETINVPVFDMGTEVSPVEIVRQGLAQARENKNDYVLIDTAGRLAIDEVLMDELKQIKEVAQPDEILLVVDAMTGQDAVNVAAKFNEDLGITGVIITKLDGDTRGGAALSIRQVTGAPIKFSGTGEKLTDLEVFHPERMSSRILGMGDMLTLIEKAQQDYDEKKAEELAQKMRENSFDFNDFIEQMDQVNNMGPIEDLIKMIPGMSQMPGIENMQVDPKQMARQKAMVLSMTKEERENPDMLNPSRRRRIAKGSGNAVIEVNKMIKSFNQAKEMMQMMTNGNMDKMMSQMGMSGMPGMNGRGIKGKLGDMAMKQAMNRMNKQLKKKKKKRK
jgi:signal recognition particle subunit SRP54